MSDSLLNYRSVFRASYFDCLEGTPRQISYAEHILANVRKMDSRLIVVYLKGYIDASVQWDERYLEFFEIVFAAALQIHEFQAPAKVKQRNAIALAFHASLVHLKDSKRV